MKAYRCNRGIAPLFSFSFTSQPPGPIWKHLRYPRTLSHLGHFAEENIFILRRECDPGLPLSSLITRASPFSRLALKGFVLFCRIFGRVIVKRLAMYHGHPHLHAINFSITTVYEFQPLTWHKSPSQRPRALRHRSAAARLLRFWFRIPPGTWMSLCCECCVWSGRDLHDELITRPEEFYRLWCVVECDLETSWMRRPWPTGDCRSKRKKNMS